MYYLKNKIMFSLALWCVATLASFPEVYFSPADNIRNKLITMIKQEQDSIKMAVYLITDKSIVEALGKAKERGVSIEVVADVLSVDKGWGKVLLLQNYDIPVFVYDGGAQSIMHNKFFIFGRNKDNKKLLWTGSYNPTQKADRANRENVIIEDNELVAQAYEREFVHLKKISRCFSHEPSKSSRFAPKMTEQLQESFKWSFF